MKLDINAGAVEVKSISFPTLFLHLSGTALPAPHTTPKTHGSRRCSPPPPAWSPAPSPFKSDTPAQTESPPRLASPPSPTSHRELTPTPRLLHRHLPRQPRKQLGTRPVRNGVLHQAHQSAKHGPLVAQQPRRQVPRVHRHAHHAPRPHRLAYSTPCAQFLVLERAYLALPDAGTW